MAGTEEEPEGPAGMEEVADAWAAVLIDVHKKRQERGELPEGDAAQPEEGDSTCPTT